jgi:hypothetical protein
MAVAVVVALAKASAQARIPMTRPMTTEKDDHHHGGHPVGPEESRL